jgi:membrane-bound lytic murein transglycosylase B
MSDPELSDRNITQRHLLGVCSMYLVAMCFLLFGLTSAAEANPVFDRFISEVRKEAASQGISERHLVNLDRLTPEPEVTRLASSQPEYVKPIWAYLEHLITPNRLTLGRENLTAYRPYLDKLETQYGVSVGIIVAIWGVETNYGSNKGSFHVLQTLATLGYEGRRAKFGRQQLLAALQILQSGDVTINNFYGSWAGAMGHTQFIPTTYLAYAADGTGDGKRDVWTSPHDALASTANYLKVSGWQRDMPWGFEVVLPENFDYGVAGLDQRAPAARWRERQVRAARGAKVLPDSLGEMSLFLPSGHRGPAFLVTQNFRALLRYNTAPAYALAVGRLSERFSGAVPLVGDWPLGDRPLKPPEIFTLQRFLRKAGYLVGDIDGVAGRKTISAIRAYQREAGLIADGYPTPGLLTHLRQKNKLKN